jgi:hypothetical protein
MPGTWAGQPDPVCAAHLRPSRAQVPVPVLGSRPGNGPQRERHRHFPLARVIAVTDSVPLGPPPGGRP